MSLDFTKNQLFNFDPAIIRDSPLLPFEIRNVSEDGEVLQYNSKGALRYKTPYHVAFYKGLEFKIYEPTKSNELGYASVEGSFHKYWNDGAHNYNDFKIENLESVIDELKTKFNITPKNLRFKQLELGVNINTPYKTEDVLNACLMHKKKPFKWVYTRDEGKYIQCRHSQYTIKVYDKRLHYEKRGFEIDHDILRFEIKFEKMERINKLGICTLQDLLNFGLINLKSLLLSEWDNVLFYDYEALDGTRYEDKYSNYRFWEKLKDDNYKYHRTNMRKQSLNNSGNIKSTIATLINNKYEELNTETTRIDPLYILSN